MKDVLVRVIVNVLCTCPVYVETEETVMVVKKWTLREERRKGRFQDTAK